MPGEYVYHRNRPTCIEIITSLPTFFFFLPCLWEFCVLLYWQKEQVSKWMSVLYFKCFQIKYKEYFKSKASYLFPWRLQHIYQTVGDAENILTVSSAESKSPSPLDAVQCRTPSKNKNSREWHLNSSDSETPILDIWGIWITPSLPLLQVHSDPEW